MITAPAGYSWVRTSTFTVSGTSQSGATVELFDGSTSFGTTTATAAGTWSRAITVSGDGAYLITAKASNLSAPTTFTLTGTAEAGTTVEVFEDGSSRGTVAAGNGTWSKQFTGTPNGTHTYTARTTDIAGNTSVLSTGSLLKIG